VSKTTELKRERKRCDRLLCQMLPKAVVRQLKQRRQVRCRRRRSLLCVIVKRLAEINLCALLLRLCCVPPMLACARFHRDVSPRSLCVSVSFSQRTLLGGPFVTETFRPPNILCWRSPGETALASNSIDAQCSSPTLYRFCV
jgi:hypothetical protein